MLFIVITIIAVISILLACLSLYRQSKLDEIKGVKKTLKQERVVFHRDESKKSD
jgi:hypothetical protein